MPNQPNTSLDTLYTLLSKRRSQYQISADWVAPQEQVEELIQQILQKTPSAFNSQPVRVVLLTSEKHLAHWQLIEDALIAIIGKKRYEEETAPKLNSAFRSGIATLLFFDDTTVTKGLQEQMPLYADNFARWAHEVQGSHQILAWLGLSQLGFGCNLQHYTGMVDDQIKQLAGVPAEWNLVAQMPFGKLPADNTLVPQEKRPLDELFKVL